MRVNDQFTLAFNPTRRGYGVFGEFRLTFNSILILLQLRNVVGMKITI